MKTVVAALDSSPAARPVLETAGAFGALTGAVVDAVHVGNGSPEMLRTLAGRHGLALRLLDGSVEPALLDCLSKSDVIAAVVGARATPAGRRPIGRTAARIVEQAKKPIVVVPPEAVDRQARDFGRVLVPLEGSEESSRPVLEDLCPLLAHDIELIVLHVFTEATMPRFLDRPSRDIELLGAEFTARHCPAAASIELRTGPIGARVAEVTRECAADLVVLSWSQVTSPGRAAVVRDVLGASTIPVLLLPAGGLTPPGKRGSVQPDAGRR